VKSIPLFHAESIANVHNELYRIIRKENIPFSNLTREKIMQIIEKHDLDTDINKYKSLSETDKKLIENFYSENTPNKHLEGKFLLS
jgi:hypothetical protein